MIKLIEETFSTKIERLLFDFGVKTKSVKKVSRNNFDIYDIELSSGTKFSKLEKILPELGMGLKSKSTPRGYPVMSEGIYRLEVQVKDFDKSELEEYFEEFDRGYCPIAIGSNASGDKVVSDLSKFPNLLIAGATGSGKSVVLHNIIISLIKNNSDIYLADPKMVEFSAYEELPQVKKICYDAEDTLTLIEDMNSKMNKRFAMLKSSRSRNMMEHNKKTGSNIRPAVIVIDEWADLFLQDKSLEKPLCKLAQKCRAAGMSIVLATQRPSVKVISGLIKANFLGRISMRVSNSIDSRIVLDRNGAEKLKEVGTGIFIDEKQKVSIFKSPFVEDIAEFMEANID